MVLGAGSTEILSGKTVAVFGLGGVGSYVVEGLARSGIGRFVLVDHDVIRPSNLNRQLIATHGTLGRPKVEVMHDRILDINPAARVETHFSTYGIPGLDGLDFSAWSYVVDCIDMVTAKLLLVENARRAGVPIISSMGTGNKVDPTRLELADINKTSVCPLARVMRRELKRRGIKKLKVLYSREVPLKAIAQLEAAPAPAPETVPADTGGFVIDRKNRPGSVSFVPSVAGLIIAGEVVKDLLKQA